VKYTYGQREACAYCGHDIEFHDESGWIDRGGGRRCLTYLDRAAGEFVYPATDHSPTRQGDSPEREDPMHYDLYDPQHKLLLDALLIVQLQFPTVTKVLVNPKDQFGRQEVFYMSHDNGIVFHDYSKWPLKDASSVGVLTAGAVYATSFLKGEGGVFHMIPPKAVPHDKPVVEPLPGEKLVRAAKPEPRGTKITNPLIPAAKAFAKDFFDAKVKAFVAAPGGDNWRLLRYAMWTLQSAHCLGTHHVKDLVKHWPANEDATDEQCAEALVQAVNGQSLEELRKDEAKYDLDGSQ